MHVRLSQYGIDMQLHGTVRYTEVARAPVLVRMGITISLIRVTGENSRINRGHPRLFRDYRERDFIVFIFLQLIQSHQRKYVHRSVPEVITRE